MSNLLVSNAAASASAATSNAAAAASAAMSNAAAAAAAGEKKKCFKAQASTERKSVKVVKKDEYSIEFKYEIADFLAQPAKVGDRISVEWPVPEKYLKFEMEVYPGGYEDDSTGFVSVFFANNSKRHVTFTGMKDSVVKNGKKVMMKKDEQRIVAKCVPERRFFGWHKFIKRSEIEANPEKYLENGALTIMIEYGIEEDIEIEDEYPNTAVKDVAEVIKDAFMKEGLDGLTNTDVTLICDDGEVKCHKYMLGVHSKVFHVYFEEDHDTEENNTSTVKVQDFSIDAIKEMVRFLYTDEFEEEYENACELLDLAQKYDIESLKTMTESFLCTKISDKTAAELLGMGKTHLANKLKDMSMAFIMRNPKMVTKMEGMSDLMKIYPEIMIEMFANMMPPA